MIIIDSVENNCSNSDKSNGENNGGNNYGGKNDSGSRNSVGDNNYLNVIQYMMTYDSNLCFLSFFISSFLFQILYLNRPGKSLKKLIIEKKNKKRNIRIIHFFRILASENASLL